MLGLRAIQIEKAWAISISMCGVMHCKNVLAWHDRIVWEWQTECVIECLDKLLKNCEG